MDNLYEYFNKYTNYVDFLTINNLKINKKNYNNITLPISHLELVENVKNEKFIDEISLEYFAEGILLFNSIDYKFNYIEKLNEFLSELKIDLYELVMKKIKLEQIDENTLLYNILLLRGYFLLGNENFLTHKLYLKQLIEFVDFIDINYRDILINEISILLNMISQKYEDDYLMNILYGDYSIIEKNYIKAELYYNKAMEYTADEKIIKLIKNKKKKIFPKVNIEILLHKIEKFRYDEAINILEKILKQEINLDCEDLYWIGYSYNKLDMIEQSIFYYEKSLELNGDFLNIFIEIGILYYKQSKFKKALKIYEKGLSIYTDNEILLFNKILIEIKLNLFEKAQKDIETILLYEDLDNSILNDILYIKNKYFSV